MKKIDLNVDIAEGFPNDLALLEFATSANVCCGAHAGDSELTRITVESCLAKGIRIGAHPGYPDRISMGREPLSVEHQRDYLDSVLAQIRSFCYSYPAAYVKPHGGLYNDTAQPLTERWDSMRTYPTAKSPYEAGGLALSQVPGTGVLIMTLRLARVGLMGLDRTMHRPIAERANMPFIREGFADRSYREDGTLTPRSEEGAVFQDPAQVREQVLRLAPEVDSICLHGDTPNAVEFAELVYRTLQDAGYEISA